MTKTEPEIHIAGDQARVMMGRRTLMSTSLGAALESFSQGREQHPGCEILPRDVRIWTERRDATAVALEIPPHARTVRWLKDDSKAPFGPEATYGKHLLNFPYVILLIVFRRGALTNYQQLYYRIAPLTDEDQELLLPNLYNVAQGYGQRCWLCLAQLRRISGLGWSEKLARISDHVFCAAYNRSAEEHEGNSYWAAMRDVDPRVSSVENWERETRRNRCFALQVAWKPAETTANQVLREMLDAVVAPPPEAPSATDLVGWLSRPRPDRKKS